MHEKRAAMRLFSIVFLLLVTFGLAVPSQRQSFPLDHVERQVTNPIYLAIRKANVPGVTLVEPIYEGSTFCPGELSDTGISIECVSPIASSADIYVNGNLVSQDTTRPFTVQGESAANVPIAWNYPTGAVNIVCYTQLWYTWANINIVECASTQPPPPQAPAPTAPPTVPSPSPASLGNGGGPGVVGSGGFNILQVVGGSPTPRKEACSVVVGNRLYLVGGREGKPVNYYDFGTRSWYQTANFGPPDLHHCGCAVFQDRFIYIPTSWYGTFPFEGTHTEMFIYDTVSDVWSSGPSLGVRSRGAASVGIYNGKLYVAMGNRGGHGSHATSLGEFDVFDFATQTWTALPNAPDPRDHVGGSAVIGNLFCVGGGRNGGVDNFWGTPIVPVNCFNFLTNSWERRANLPTPRGGVGNTATCQGLLMIAGGEGSPPGTSSGGDAYNRVDLYDPSTNSFLPPVYMSIKRHGMTLAASDCSCGNIYYASGAAGLGDGPLQVSTEVWSPDGQIRNC